VSSLGGVTIADDTSTNATRYIHFGSATSGAMTTVNTSSTNLYFNPSTGNFTVAGSVTAYSDRRIKENIAPIEGALQSLLKLQGVTYTRKDTGETGRGFVAQDVQGVYPELVVENTDNKMLSVAYAHMMGDVVEAIRELDRRQTQSIMSNNNWTMIGDDEADLFVINRRTGKRYQFLLKEV
jgi:hypothetical protein